MPLEEVGARSQHGQRARAQVGQRLHGVELGVPQQPLGEHHAQPLKHDGQRKREEGRPVQVACGVGGRPVWRGSLEPRGARERLAARTTACVSLLYPPEAASDAVAMAVPSAMSAVPARVAREGCSSRRASPTASVTSGVAAFIMLMKATEGAGKVGQCMAQEPMQECRGCSGGSRLGEAEEERGEMSSQQAVVRLAPDSPRYATFPRKREAAKLSDTGASRVSACLQEGAGRSGANPTADAAWAACARGMSGRGQMVSSSLAVLLGAPRSNTRRLTLTLTVRLP